MKGKKWPQSHTDQKGKNKIALSSNDRIFYVENFKESMKKYLLELISEFILVVGTRSTYKNQLYFYILAMNMWTLN